MCIFRRKAKKEYSTNPSGMTSVNLYRLTSKRPSGRVINGVYFTSKELEEGKWIGSKFYTKRQLLLIGAARQKQLQDFQKQSMDQLKKASQQSRNNMWNR